MFGSADDGVGVPIPGSIVSGFVRVSGVLGSSNGSRLDCPWFRCIDRRVIGVTHVGLESESREDLRLRRRS
jgi:hypothetical protein